MSSPDLMDKNQRLLLVILAVVLFMAAMAFAAVPLYNLFCRVTGYAGTTQIAQSAPDIILDRVVRIRFNADTQPNLLWYFRPDQREVSVQLGQEALISYTARNEGHRPLTGTAIFNVTPEKAGKYFHKTQCFCFGEQTLQPGQDMPMPVVFYVDPAMDDDKEMDDVSMITLSYTFFRSESQELDEALEDYSHLSSE